MFKKVKSEIKSFQYWIHKKKLFSFLYQIILLLSKYENIIYNDLIGVFHEKIIILIKIKNYKNFYGGKLLMNIHNKMWLLTEPMMSSHIFSFQLHIHAVFNLPVFRCCNGSHYIFVVFAYCRIAVLWYWLDGCRQKDD